MAIILETKDFQVIAHDNPHHDRNNGGHAKISPKQSYTDRTSMPQKLYLDMMKLVRLTGKAITIVMKQKGINVSRINYQDNGNWAFMPGHSGIGHIHIHLYVRSSNERHPAGDKRFRAFPEALFFPFKDTNEDYYESFRPYSTDDCGDIKSELLRLIQHECPELI